MNWTPIAESDRDKLAKVKKQRDELSATLMRVKQLLKIGAYDAARREIARAEGRQP